MTYISIFNSKLLANTRGNSNLHPVPSMKPVSPSRPSAAQSGSFWLAASLANKLMRLGTADSSHVFVD